MSLPAAPAVLGGAALGAVFGTVALVRRDRPLHAYGSSYLAELDVQIPAQVGVPLLDEPGRREVLVRLSRAASLTHGGPDVMGMAVRVPAAATDGGSADILLASTGLGRVTRHLLVVHRRPDAGPMTTLLPSRTPSGDLLLGVRPTAPGSWSVGWSRPGQQRWMLLGELRLGARTDDPGHLDPVGRPPVGMPPPAWVRRLRDPAYRWSRTLLGPVGGPRPGSRG